MRKSIPTLKNSINQAFLENGTYDQIVKHLEMELNGLEADEHLVKTQMTVTKKEQNTDKSGKKQNDKAKKPTPKTVPDKILKNDQCRYCKETGHMMADCPKLAKRRKLEEDPDAEKFKIAIHLDMTKKTVTSVPISKSAHLNAPSQKTRKKVLKTTNKPKHHSNQRWTDHNNHPPRI